VEIAKVMRIHLEEGNHRAIRVDIPTLSQQICGGLGGTQYDDDPSKNMEGHDVPYEP